MSIEDFKNSSAYCGGKFGSIWEIQLQKCDHVHGSVECGADPNSEPCYNTYKTCQRKCNFKCKNKSEFKTNCEDKSFLTIAPSGYSPDVQSYTNQSGDFKLFSGAPAVSSQTLVLSDSRGSDWEDDPYPERRTKDPKENGTRIEKWIQRNDIEGRLVHWYYGACGSSFPDSWIKRSFFIDSIDGPNGKNCTYSLKLKDQFSLISSDKRKIPAEIEGLRFQSPVLPQSTHINVPGLRAAFERSYINASNAPQIMTICSGDYVYDVVQEPLCNNTANGSRYKIINKGVCGTKRLTGEDKIEVDEQLTIAKYWPKGTNIVEIIFDIIFQNGVGIPSSQSFNGEPLFEDIEQCDCGPFLADLYDPESFKDMANCVKDYFTDDVIICDPTSPNELLDEIAKAYLIAPYIDDCTGMIKLKRISPPDCNIDLEIIDECFMSNFKMKRNRSNRLTSVKTYAEPENCASGNSDLLLQNIVYNTLSLQDDSNPLANFLSCDAYTWKPPKSEDIRTRFFNGCNRYQALNVASRMAYIRKDAPIEVEFEISGAHLCFNKTDYILLNNQNLQNSFGCASDEVFIVNSINLQDATGNCWSIKAESTGFKNSDNWATNFGCDSCGSVYHDFTGTPEERHMTYAELLVRFDEILDEVCPNRNLESVFDPATDHESPEFFGENTNNCNSTPYVNPDYSDDNRDVGSYIRDLYKCNYKPCANMW